MRPGGWLAAGRAPVDIIARGPAPSDYHSRIIDAFSRHACLYTPAPTWIGTLEPGATADVSVLEVVSGNLELVDSTGATRVWGETLVPVATVKSGDVLRL